MYSYLAGMLVDKLIKNLNDLELGYDVAKAVFEYYGLKDYIAFIYNEVANEKSIQIISAYDKNSESSGEEKFWQRVFSGELIPGSKLILKNFQISSWFPRKPGLYWTYTASKVRQLVYKDRISYFEKGVAIFDIWGKAGMTELGGIGTVNFRKNRENIFLTATASGYTERGIPLVVSQNIWKEINSHLLSDKMIEVDLKGTIAELPCEADSIFFRRQNLPKIILKIDSILNIQYKQSDTNIIISPWTIFKTKSKDCPFGFTYVRHNLQRDDMSKTIDWMMNYMDNNGRKLIITDFDEETNSLNSRFPLQGYLENLDMSDELLEYCQNIPRIFKMGRKKPSLTKRTK